MKLFKIINARIRTTNTIHNVWDGNKLKKRTDVTYRPQVQIKFLWFTWWENVCCIECLSRSFAMNSLIGFIKENHKNEDVIETEYEYIEI